MQLQTTCPSSLYTQLNSRHISIDSYKTRSFKRTFFEMSKITTLSLLKSQAICVIDLNRRPKSLATSNHKLAIVIVAQECILVQICFYNRIVLPILQVSFKEVELSQDIRAGLVLTLISEELYKGK